MVVVVETVLLVVVEVVVVVVMDDGYTDKIEVRGGRCGKRVKACGCGHRAPPTASLACNATAQTTAARSETLTRHGWSSRCGVHIVCTDAIVQGLGIGT